MLGLQVAALSTSSATIKLRWLAAVSTSSVTIGLRWLAAVSTSSATIKLRWLAAVSTSKDPYRWEQGCDVVDGACDFVSVNVALGLRLGLLQQRQQDQRKLLLKKIGCI